MPHRNRVLLFCILVCLSEWATAGATITIVNVNAPGVGFNDAAPATPVGGNTGTTVGEQRLIAFQFAANIWGANLDSTVELKVNAQFTALSCTANSGVLGSAGATGSTANFSNAEFTDTWYPVTLASKRAGTDLSGGGVHINANFNSNLGTTGCLESSAWYYGLDTNQPAGQINLVAVVLHELGHGLGFSLGPTSLTTGAHAQALPSIYERKLFDIGIGKSWLEMTDAERVSSAINPGNVVWTGSQVLAAAPNVLSGTPQLTITAPGAIAGNYAVGTASFGAALTGSPVAGQFIVATDAADGNGPLTSDACSTINNGGSVSGKIAVVDRGTCNFTVKAKNVQNAGAIAMVVVDNVEASPPPGLGGTDPTVTIPSVRVTMANGNAIKAQLAVPATVNGFLALDLTQLAGADSQGRPKLYTPNPLEQGSSISHWDTSALPNQLMEPNISSDLSHSVKPPQDLTQALLIDIGWTAAAPTTAPIVGLSPSALAFGNALVGFGAFNAPITLSNTGNAGLLISSIVLSGNGDFSRTHDCPGTLAAGAQCTVSIAFTPSSLTSKTGTLTITSNAAGSPHMLAISGTGVSDLALSLTRPLRPARNGAGSANVYELMIAPAPGLAGMLVLGCSGKGLGVSCTVEPGSAALSGVPVSAKVVVKGAARSLRLRRQATTESRTIVIHATINGRTRNFELPVQIQR